MTEERSWGRKDLPGALIVALEAALDKGARAPVMLRMTEKAGWTDWVLILSGRSDRNVRGIVEGITDALTKTEREPLGTDGLEESLWALLDYDDFLIHTFYHPVRTYYDLESMWNDAPRVELGLPESMLGDSDLLDLEAPDPMPSFRGDMTFGGFDDEFDDEFDDDELDDDELDDDDSVDHRRGADGDPARPQPTDDEADDESLFED